MQVHLNVIFGWPVKLTYNLFQMICLSQSLYCLNRVPPNLQLRSEVKHGVLKTGSEYAVIK